MYKVGEGTPHQGCTRDPYYFTRRRRLERCPVPYEGWEETLQCKVDIRYSSDEGHRSTAGYVVTIMGAAVDWASQAQKKVTPSGNDVECVTIYRATQGTAVYATFFSH